MAGNKDLSIAEKVTVEADFDGAPGALPAFVTNVLADEMWLATRLPDPRVGRLKRGQSVHLTFDRNGSVILDSTFLRRLGEASRLETQKSRVFAVERPTGADSGQRRAHVRVDLDRKIGIRSLGAAGGQRIGSGRTVNVGAGGVLFRTSMPLLFGEELKLAIALTPRDIIIAAGSIVRTEENLEDGDTTRIAVRFDDISEADQEKITCYILQAKRLQRMSEDGQVEPSMLADGAESADAPEAL